MALSTVVLAAIVCGALLWLVNTFTTAAGETRIGRYPKGNATAAPSSGATEGNVRRSDRRPRQVHPASNAIANATLRQTAEAKPRGFESRP